MSLVQAAFQSRNVLQVPTDQQCHWQPHWNHWQAVGKRGESEGGVQSLPGTLEDSQPLLIQLLSDLSRGLHLPSARTILLSCSWFTFTQLDAGSGIYPCEHHSWLTAKWWLPEEGNKILRCLYGERERERREATVSFCPVCPWVWNSPTLLLQLQPELQPHIFLLSGVPADLEFFMTVKPRPALDKHTAHLCAFTQITTTYWENWSPFHQGQKPRGCAIAAFIKLCFRHPSVQCVVWDRTWNFCSLTVWRLLFLGRSLLGRNVLLCEIINPKI